MFCFTQQMPVKAGAGQCQSQEPTTSGLPDGSRNPRGWTILFCPAGTLAGIWSEAEAGLNPIPSDGMLLSHVMVPFTVHGAYLSLFHF